MVDNLPPAAANRPRWAIPWERAIDWSDEWIIREGRPFYLVKVLHRFRNGVVDDESHVGLIDPHAERDGRHHGLSFRSDQSVSGESMRSQPLTPARLKKKQHATRPKR